MIDVHLFLGRPLRNSPSEENSNDPSSSSSRMGGAADKVFYHGRVPLELIDDFGERIREMHHVNTDLVGFLSLLCCFSPHVCELQHTQRERMCVFGKCGAGEGHIDVS